MPAPSLASDCRHLEESQPSTDSRPSLHPWCLVRVTLHFQPQSASDLSLASPASKRQLRDSCSSVQHESSCEALAQSPHNGHPSSRHLSSQRDRRNLENERRKSG